MLPRLAATISFLYSIAKIRKICETAKQMTVKCRKKPPMLTHKRLIVLILKDYRCEYYCSSSNTKILCKGNQKISECKG